ncbi:hypothetical protein MTO96_048427, partial [Rhipicephalus appendiculatus]
LEPASLMDFVSTVEACPVDARWIAMALAWPALAMWSRIGAGPEKLIRHGSHTRPDWKTGPL